MRLGLFVAFLWIASGYVITKTIENSCKEKGAAYLITGNKIECKIKE